MSALSVVPYVLDDLVLESARRDRSFHFAAYRPGTMVVLGRGSDPSEELHLGACLEDGVILARRRGGGCAVVLDPGNVVVTAAMPLPGLDGIKAAFERLTAWLVAGLERSGVPGLAVDGVSDLVLSGRKVGGSCLMRARGLVLFSSTILADPDVSLMERYLAHPPREPGYRRHRPHREFVGSLTPVLGRDAPRVLLERLERELDARGHQPAFPPTRGQSNPGIPARTADGP